MALLVKKSNKIQCICQMSRNESIAFNSCNRSQWLLWLGVLNELYARFKRIYWPQTYLHLLTSQGFNLCRKKLHLFLELSYIYVLYQMFVSKFKLYNYFRNLIKKVENIMWSFFQAIYNCTQNRKFTRPLPTFIFEYLL